MTSWLRLDENLWVLNYRGTPFACKNLRELVVGSLEVGITWKQMYAAMGALDDNDHNYCEFGVGKTFTISKRV